MSMLRLSHASDIPTATYHYHASVTESGKTESTRLALTVEPYQAPAPHALAGTGNDFNIIQSNKFIMGVILPSNAPNSLTSIGDYAFYNCSSLAGTLALPSGITSVGNYVFFGCSGLTGSLVISSGVTSVGNYAFYGCSCFAGNFIIPSGVASAGTNAFGAAGFQPSAFRQASPASLSALLPTAQTSLRSV
ncbi:MAG: leucine-rich repeat domain-containing protein [Treponematales bacterium]